MIQILLCLAFVLYINTHAAEKSSPGVALIQQYEKREFYPVVMDILKPTTSAHASQSFVEERKAVLIGYLDAVATVFPATKAHARGLGNEYDVNVTYNYTEDVTFGVSLGWYVPGSALTSANNSTASQALANVGVKF